MRKNGDIVEDDKVPLVIAKTTSSDFRGFDGPPPDTNNFVYISFFIFGIGNLLTLNSLFSTLDYFDSRVRIASSHTSAAEGRRL